MHRLEGICHLVAQSMVVIGVVIITIGVLKAILEYLKIELSRDSFHEKSLVVDAARSDLGAYLLMGLEFSVAADIILTMLEPDYQGLIILGGLIVIRTTIAYFLGKEREDIRRELKDEAL